MRCAEDDHGVTVTDVLIYFSGHSGHDLSEGLKTTSRSAAAKKAKADAAEKRHPVICLKPSAESTLYDLDFDGLIEAAQLKNRVGAITYGLIIDGCRTHVGKSLTGKGQKSAVLPPSPVVNGWMAFATQPGTTALSAYQACASVYSVYTHMFLKYLPLRRDINALFRAVCAEVATVSRQEQLPWYHESLQIMHEDQGYSLRRAVVATPASSATAASAAASSATLPPSAPAPAAASSAAASTAAASSTAAAAAGSSAGSLPGSAMVTSTP